MRPAPHRTPPTRAALGRGRGPLTALGLLLLLVPGLAAARPSSFSRSGGGTKALYLLLEDLGYRPARLFKPGDLTAEHHVVVAVGSAPEEEDEAILKWVRQGKLAIVALPLFGAKGHCGDTRFGSLSLKRKLSLESEAPRPHHADLSLRPAACLLKVPLGGKLLAGREEAALAVEVTAEQGRLLFLAHEDLLVNAHLRRDDLVVLVRRWLSDHGPARGRIAFLEDQRSSASLLQLAQRSHLSAFLLHALAWLILLYWSRAPRFGDPRLVFSAQRREFSQHARALGHLLQHRRASAYALRKQYERFLERVLGRAEPGARFGGAPRGLRGNRAALAALVATRSGRDAAGVESLLAQVEYTIGSPELADPRDVQRHFRLSQGLAALQHTSATSTRGDKRGHAKIR